MPKKPKVTLYALQVFCSRKNHMGAKNLITSIETPPPLSKTQTTSYNVDTIKNSPEKKRYIRCVKSRMGCVSVEGDSLALFTVQM